MFQELTEESKVNDQKSTTVGIIIKLCNDFLQNKQRSKCCWNRMFGYDREYHIVSSLRKDIRQPKTDEITILDAAIQSLRSLTLSNFGKNLLLELKNLSDAEKEKLAQKEIEEIPDYYETLGVSRCATQEEIKNKFRQLARENHPDKRSKLENYMSMINQAYAALKDADERSQYDQKLISFESKKETDSERVKHRVF